MSSGASADPDDAVDAVYTWVDGRGRGFQDALRRYAPAPAPEGDAASARIDRFRDNGELRFSVRSLLRYAPWVRRIHVLTNGQVPSWLDFSSPRVCLVSHRDVFREPGGVPSFNSNAIEMNLHRIPGLARRFLYLNDDVFLGRPVGERDFFLPTRGQTVYLQDTPLPTDPDHGSMRDRSCAHTQAAVDRLWGRPPSPRLLPAHVPQAYDRDRLANLERLLPDEFHRTALHRLRDPNDLVLAVAYAALLCEAPEEAGRHEVVVLRDPSPQYRLLMLAGNPLASMRALLAVCRTPPRFFCINDDMGGAGRHHPVLLLMRALLRVSFPRRSEAERHRLAVRRGGPTADPGVGACWR